MNATSNCEHIYNLPCGYGATWRLIILPLEEEIHANSEAKTFLSLARCCTQQLCWISRRLSKWGNRSNSQIFSGIARASVRRIEDRIQHVFGDDGRRGFVRSHRPSLLHLFQTSPLHSRDIEREVSAFASLLFPHHFWSFGTRFAWVIGHYNYGEGDSLSLCSKAIVTNLQSTHQQIIVTRFRGELCGFPLYIW